MDTELIKANLVIERARLKKREAQHVTLTKRIMDTEDRVKDMRTKQAELAAAIDTKRLAISELEKQLGEATP